MIQEGSPKYNDLVDVMIQASTSSIEVEQPDKAIKIEQILDEEKLWWKTGLINSNTFGRFAYELKEFERTAVLAFSNMTFARATALAKEIIDIGKSYRRSIDAKSSESRRDKQNSQSTLLDKIGKNKVEKVYTAKGELKKSMLDSFLARDVEKDQDNE